MARIVVIGGTGYAGGHIATEAASRGHDVVAVARKAPTAPAAGVTYVQGSILDLDSLASTLADADVVISAIAPRGDMTDEVIPALKALADRLSGTSTRLGVVGGAMGSLSAAGGPPLYTLGIPDEYAHEAQVGVDSLELLRAADQGLEWFFVHPPKDFGAWVPGERTGSYRDGGDVVVVDDEGKSYISGADFALAVVDEIEKPRHRRGRFTVGY